MNACMSLNASSVAIRDQAVFQGILRLLNETCVVRSSNPQTLP